MSTRVLADKRVIVTGSSRGLGRAIALDAARHGASVVLNGRDEEALQSVAAELTATGASYAVVPGNVADVTVARRLVDSCVAEFGGVDGLVNNAGICRDRTILKMTDEEFDDVIAVNLRGTWACTRAAVEAMRDNGGSVINLTSNSAFQANIGQSNYAAAKAGIVGMTRTLSVELARFGIRINALWPLAETDMTRGVIDRMIAQAAEAGSPSTAQALGFGRPEDVAPMATFLLSDHAKHVNGQVVSFNGARLALWTHPREVNITERDRWNVEALIADFDLTAGRELQELYRRHG